MQPMYHTSVFMNLAFDQAEAALKIGEVPVGCVVVLDRQVIGAAHNRTLVDANPAAHAEVLAIQQACQALGVPYLTDADLYSTLEPCSMCASLIAKSRIRRLYYASFDPKMGCVDHGVQFFDRPQSFHKPECYGGLGHQRGQELLRAFFLKKRNKPLSRLANAGHKAV